MAVRLPLHLLEDLAEHAEVLGGVEGELEQSDTPSLGIRGVAEQLVGQAARRRGNVGAVQTAGCVLRPDGQQMILTVAGAAGTWTADFFDTSTGTNLATPLSLAAAPDSTLTVALPPFTGDIAFQLSPHSR